MDTAQRKSCFTVRAVALTALIVAQALGQQGADPEFIAAEIRSVSPNAEHSLGGAFPGGDRYELRGVTIADMVAQAWGVSSDRVVSGPGLSPADHFNVLASFVPGTPPDRLTGMLRNLLVTRFGLQVHEDTRSVAAYALTVSQRGLKLKQSADSGEAGCKPDDRGEARADYVNFSCRNMTIEAFSVWLRTTERGYFSRLSLVDQTGLAPSWDFSVRLPRPESLSGGIGRTLFDEIEGQLGLKVSSTRTAMRVVVLDHVNNQPTDDPPGVESLLAGPPAFEVEVIKPSRPDEEASADLRPGRVELRHSQLRNLIELAFNIDDDSQLFGLPEAVGSNYFDISAKSPASAPASTLGMNPLQVMLQEMLKRRFGLILHIEDRPGDAYVLLANNPKLKLADPASPSGCQNVPPVVGGAVNRSISCHNVAIAQFVESLRQLAGGYFQRKPAVDGTGLSGRWDIALNFSAANLLYASDESADPSGAISLSEALKNQLGLKLQLTKRPVAAFIVDHVNVLPSDN